MDIGPKINVGAQVPSSDPQVSSQTPAVTQHSGADAAQAGTSPQFPIPPDAPIVAPGHAASDAAASAASTATVPVSSGAKSKSLQPAEAAPALRSHSSATMGGFAVRERSSLGDGLRRLSHAISRSPSRPPSKDSETKVAPEDAAARESGPASPRQSDGSTTSADGARESRGSTRESRKSSVTRANAVRQANKDRTSENLIFLQAIKKLYLVKESSGSADSLFDDVKTFIQTFVHATLGQGQASGGISGGPAFSVNIGNEQRDAILREWRKLTATKASERNFTGMCCAIDHAAKEIQNVVRGDHGQRTLVHTTASALGSESWLLRLSTDAEMVAWLAELPGERQVVDVHRMAAELSLADDPPPANPKSYGELFSDAVGVFMTAANSPTKAEILEKNIVPKFAHLPYRNPDAEATVTQAIVQLRSGTMTSRQTEALIDALDLLKETNTNTGTATR